MSLSDILELLFCFIFKQLREGEWRLICFYKHRDSPLLTS
mgnify:CR=1 FL=1|jgi:hypothetical protein